MVLREIILAEFKSGIVSEYVSTDMGFDVFSALRKTMLRHVSTI